MAAVTQGTAHLYGIQGGVGVITNATVLSFSKTESHANTNETVNEIGNAIEWRADDLRVEATITVRIRTTFTDFVPGNALTYEGTTYVIISKAIDETSTDFVTHTYQLRGYEYITEA